MRELYQDLVDTLSCSLPDLLTAIAVLFIGWLAALLIAAMVRAVVRRIGDTITVEIFLWTKQGKKTQ